MMQVHKISTSFGIFPNQTYIRKRIFSGYSTHSSYFLILHPLKKYILHCEILNHHSLENKYYLFRISFFWSFLVKSSPATVEFRLIGLGGCVRHQDLWRHHFRFPFFFREKKKNLNCHITKKTSRLLLCSLPNQVNFFCAFFFFLLQKMSLSFIQCPELQSIS